jgi:hypothetical protein
MSKLLSYELILIKYSRSTFERNTLLQERESRRIIKVAGDIRSSLLSLNSLRSTDTEAIESQDGVDSLDTEFDFDNQVISTKVYRAALKSHLRAAGLKGMSSNAGDRTENTDEPSMAHKAGINNLKHLDMEHVRPDHLTLFNKTEISSCSADLRDTTFRRYSDSSVIKTTDWNQNTATGAILVDQSVSVNFSSNAVKPGVWWQTKASYNVFRMKTSASLNGSVTPGDTSNRGWHEISCMPLVAEGKGEGFKSPPLASKSSLHLCPRHDSPYGLIANVVLLGTGNSGKSTIFKSLVKAEKGFWSAAERFEYLETILDNIINGMGDVLDAMAEIGGGEAGCDEICPSHTLESITALVHNPSPIKDKFTSEAWAVAEVWVKHASVQRIINRRPRYWLTDAAP